MRILTWNVWGRNGPWQERQAAITPVLAAEAPDIVCLQEVWIADDGTTLTERLAADLGLHHVDADRHRVGSTIGNAVLSRWPIPAATTLWLPRPDGGLPYRTLLAATGRGPRRADPGALHPPRLAVRRQRRAGRAGPGHRPLHRRPPRATRRRPTRPSWPAI